MTNRFGSILLVALALALVAGPTAAQQLPDLQVGDGFQVGGVYFHVAATSEADALFRVSDHLGELGEEEHPDCFREGRTFYHVDSCPRVQAHISRYASRGVALAASGHAGGGSHPINYLRGDYVAPADYSVWDRAWGYAWAPLPFFHGPGTVIPWRPIIRPRPTPFGLHGRHGFRSRRPGSPSRW